MNIIKNISTYVDDKELKLKYYSNYIHVINYYEIKELSHNDIKLLYKRGCIILKGVDLSIKKLIKDELLIKGKVKAILFEEYENEL